MIREYTVNPPMPRIMVQPEELPILTSGPFGANIITFRNLGAKERTTRGLIFTLGPRKKKLPVKSKRPKDKINLPFLPFLGLPDSARENEVGGRSLAF